MEQFIFDTKNRKKDPVYRDIIVLNGDEHFHLARVLRIKVGSRIFVTDANGTTCLCLVRRIERDKSVCEVIEEYSGLNSSLRNFCIAAAVLKPVSKLEFAIEKCTELGVAQILLFNSERSKKVNLRLDRLQNIIVSAVKQSLQSKAPGLVFLKGLEEVVSHSHAFEEKIVFHEKADAMVYDYLLNLEKHKSVIAMVGPEGGFSDGEIDFLIGKGFKSFSLGKPRLRSETAMIKVASLLAVY
jgi:16S rRNA (uracil1498-N3)-methyltransferase